MKVGTKKFFVIEAAVLVVLLAVGPAATNAIGPKNNINSTKNPGELHNEICKEFYRIYPSPGTNDVQLIEQYLIIAMCKVTHITPEGAMEKINHLDSWYSELKQQGIDLMTGDMKTVYQTLDYLFFSKEITIKEYKMLSQTTHIYENLFSQLVEQKNDPKEFCRQLEMSIKANLQKGIVSDKVNTFIDILIHSSEYWTLEHEDNNKRINWHAIAYIAAGDAIGGLLGGPVEAVVGSIEGYELYEYTHPG